MGKKMKGNKFFKGRRPSGPRPDETAAAAATERAEADDSLMMDGWATGGSAGDGVGEAGGGGLARQSSRRGAAYDELLDQGIPDRMLRRAWVACDGDLDAAMEYVRSNFDQPLAFWAAVGDDGEVVGLSSLEGATSVAKPAVDPGEPDLGAPLRRALSVGAKPWHGPRSWPKKAPQKPEPQKLAPQKLAGPGPEPEPKSVERSSLLVPQPLHDLLAQANTALAAAHQAAASLPPEALISATGTTTDVSADLLAAASAAATAQAALGGITPRDFAELRSWNRPLQLVVKIFDAVLILLKVDKRWRSAKGTPIEGHPATAAAAADAAAEGVLEKHRGAGGHWWRDSAAMVMTLSHEDLIDRLVHFDKAGVDDATLRKLQEAIASNTATATAAAAATATATGTTTGTGTGVEPGFNPKAVEMASRCASMLCAWLVAIERYAVANRAIAAKTAAIHSAIQSNLDAAKAHIEVNSRSCHHALRVRFPISC